MKMTLEDVPSNVYFELNGRIYVYGSSMRGNELLCHPVGEGPNGWVVLNKLDVWFPKDTEVTVQPANP